MKMNKQAVVIIVGSIGDARPVPVRENGSIIWWQDPASASGKLWQEIQKGQ